MLIENADYFVRLIDLPGSVGGACNPNDDGTFNIYLNANFSMDRQRKIAVFLHEWEHLENDDLYGDKDVAVLENRPAPEQRLPDITMIGRDSRRTAPENRDILIRVMKITFPNAFKDQ